MTTKPERRIKVTITISDTTDVYSSTSRSISERSFPASASPASIGRWAIRTSLLAIRDAEASFPLEPNETKPDALLEQPATSLTDAQVASVTEGDLDDLPF